MIRIAIVGDIGCGKSYVAKQFGYPVFNADLEVAKIYKKNKRCFKKLKKQFPKHIFNFPVKKNEISQAILSDKNNIKKLNKIIHPEVRIKMKKFLYKNKNKKIIILDIPLILENKMNRDEDIIVFISAKKKEIKKRLIKRLNYNSKIFYKLRKLQLSLEIKKKKSHFVIKNNFKSFFIKKNVKNILKKIS